MIHGRIMPFRFTMAGRTRRSSADLAVSVSCWPKSAERPETLIGRDRLGGQSKLIEEVPAGLRGL
jgi:hypothetical protein